MRQTLSPTPTIQMSCEIPLGVGMYQSQIPVIGEIDGPDLNYLRLVHAKIEIRNGEE